MGALLSPTNQQAGLALEDIEVALPEPVAILLVFFIGGS